jgi:hypothetical protein
MYLKLALAAVLFSFLIGTCDGKVVCRPGAAVCPYVYAHYLSYVYLKWLDANLGA